MHRPTGLDSVVIQSVIQLWEGGVYIYNRTYWSVKINLCTTSSALPFAGGEKKDKILHRALARVFPKE